MTKIIKDKQLSIFLNKGGGFHRTETHLWQMSTVKWFLQNVLKPFLSKYTNCRRLSCKFQYGIWQIHFAKFWCYDWGRKKKRKPTEGCKNFVKCQWHYVQHYNKTSIYLAEVSSMAWNVLATAKYGTLKEMEKQAGYYHRSISLVWRPKNPAGVVLGSTG